MKRSTRKASKIATKRIRLNMDKNKQNILPSEGESEEETTNNNVETTSTEVEKADNKGSSSKDNNVKKSEETQQHSSSSKKQQQEEEEERRLQQQNAFLTSDPFLEFGSSSSGFPTRFDPGPLIELLANGNEPQVHNTALHSLANQLSMATSDQFNSPISNLATAIIRHIKAEGCDPEMLIHQENIMMAMRCLANLIEANPQATLVIAQLDAVSVLVQKLQCIEYIDFAELALSILAKISLEYPAVILKANGLVAVLQYIDFFAIHVQRTAISCAANTCRALSSVCLATPSEEDSIAGLDQVFETVSSVLPTLENLTSSPDSKILFSTVSCVSRIIDWCCKMEDKLDMLVTDSLLHGIINALSAIDDAKTGNDKSSSSSVYTSLVKILGNIGKQSANLYDVLLTRLDIFNGLSQILTANGSSKVSFDSISSPTGDELHTYNILSNKPVAHIVELLSLTADLLPSLPRENLFDLNKKSKKSLSNTSLADRDSRRLEKLVANSKPLETYINTLVPIFLSVFSSTVNSNLRRKVVECVLKGVWFVAGGTTDGTVSDEVNVKFKELMSTICSNRAFAKFISDLLTYREEAFSTTNDPSEKKESLLLVSGGIALLNVILTTAPPEESSKICGLLSREGVLSQVKHIISIAGELYPPETEEKPERGKEISVIDVEGDDGSPAKKVATLSSGSLTDEASSSKDKVKVNEGGESSQSGDKEDSRSSRNTHDNAVDLKEIKDILDKAQSSMSPLSDESEGQVFISNMRMALERMTNRGHPSFMGGLGSKTLVWINNERYAEVELGRWCVTTSESIISKISAEGDHVFSQLTQLAETLKSGGEGDDIHLSELKKLAKLVAGAGTDQGITGFELLESGIMESLIIYLTQKPQRKKIRSTKGKQKVDVPHHGLNPLSSSISSRCKSFLHVFLNGPLDLPQNPSYYEPEAFKSLVLKLQQLLSRIERFQVFSAVPTGSSGLSEAFGSSGATSTLQQLQRSMRLLLVPDDDNANDIPKNLRGGVNVSIQAVALFSQLENFLKPKIQSAGKSSVGGDPVESSSNEEDDDEEEHDDELDTDGDHQMKEAGDYDDEEDDGELDDDNDDDEIMEERLAEDEHDDDDEEEEEQERDLINVSDILLSEESKSSRKNITGSRKKNVVDVQPSSLESSSSISTKKSTGGGTSSKSGVVEKSERTKPKVEDFKLEFRIGDTTIDTSTSTIFGAVFAHQREKAGPKSAPSVWNQTFTITYRKVPVDSTSPSTSSRSNRRKTRSVAKKPSFERFTSTEIWPSDHLTTSIEDLESGSSIESVLVLLRLLYTLNTKWADFYMEEDEYFVGNVKQHAAASAAEGPDVKAPVEVIKPSIDVGSMDLVTLPLSSFQSAKLASKFNRQLDEPVIVTSKVLPSWCDCIAHEFSFLVPFETRLVYLQSTSFGYSRSFLRWQLLSREEQSGRDSRSNRIGRVLRQKVRIHRSQLLESMVKVMEIYGASQGLLEIEFFGEAGTGLGPTLEFYTDVSKLVRKRDGIILAGKKPSPSFKLWRDLYEVGDASGDYINPSLGLFPMPIKKGTNPEVEKHQIAMFSTLGAFVGKAVADGRMVDFPFNSVFLRLVLNHNLTDQFHSKTTSQLHAIKFIDSQLHHSLMELLQYLKRKREIDNDESINAKKREKMIKDVCINDLRLEDLCLDFTLPGYPDFEIKKNGKNLSVNLNNLAEYVGLVADYTVGSGVTGQVEAFRSGMNQVFNINDLKSFSINELCILFGGNDDEDWSSEAIMENLKADHGYTSGSKTIVNLVEMMAGFNQFERRKFLQFITGSVRLPYGGFRALNPRLTVVCKTVESQQKSPDDYLPSVMTCVNYLKVPNYSCIQVMKERFKVAYDEGAGSFSLS